jgi:sugar/nucleoside kinase (ribokinase family)
MGKTTKNKEAAAPASSAASDVSVGELGAIVAEIGKQYQSTTSPLVKIMDTFAVGTLFVAGLLYAYAFVFGYFPFNSFLSAFFTALGVFVFIGESTTSVRMPRRCTTPRAAVGLRLHLTRPEFSSRGELQAFAEFLFCCILLFASAINFIG